MEKVQVLKSSSVKKGSKKDGAKRKLFSGPLQTSSDLGNPPSTSSLSYDQTGLFDTEESESVTEVPTSCQQPIRKCKNGVSEGFYKNGCSPSIKHEANSSSSEDLPPTVKSPKPSLKGKFKCSMCKQTFTEHRKLIEHAEYQHRTWDRS